MNHSYDVSYLRKAYVLMKANAQMQSMSYFISGSYKFESVCFLARNKKRDSYNRNLNVMSLYMTKWSV